MTGERNSVVFVPCRTAAASFLSRSRLGVKERRGAGHISIRLSNKTGRGSSRSPREEFEWRTVLDLSHEKGQIHPRPPPDKKNAYRHRGYLRPRGRARVRQGTARGRESAHMVASLRAKRSDLMVATRRLLRPRQHLRELWAGPRTDDHIPTRLSLVVGEKLARRQS